MNPTTYNIRRTHTCLEKACGGNIKYYYCYASFCMRMHSSAFLPRGPGGGAQTVRATAAVVVGQQPFANICFSNKSMHLAGAEFTFEK